MTYWTETMSRVRMRWPEGDAWRKYFRILTGMRVFKAEASSLFRPLPRDLDVLRIAV